MGGWRTEQRRSYFAVKLPQRWWLLGIDIQFDTYIDAPQIDYFRAVAEEIEDGDGIILCTAKPSWVEGGRADSKAYATLDYFITVVLGKTRTRCASCSRATLTTTRATPRSTASARW